MKIAVVTGTRAEYGIWRPVLREIAKHQRLELQLVVTGMHLLKEFGNTVEEIECDPFPIAARVEMYQGFESPGQSLARGVAGMDTAFARLNPDVVMVLGDRLEILAAAQAAMCQRRVIAHVHGGETAPGQFDEQIRHAVTKFAQLHFCSTAVARRRIIQMGEDPRYVIQSGAPALCAVEEFWKRSGRALRAKHSAEPLLLLHPSCADIGEEFHRTGMIIRELLKFCRGKLRVIGSNNDPGHRGILSAYAAFMERIELSMSLGQEAFWREAASRGVVVGNSSSGIIELASLAVPVINIGDRQRGRERSPNIIDIPFSASALGKAMRRALSDTRFVELVSRRKNVYGNADAPRKIVRSILSVDLSRLHQAKRFHDL